MKFYAFRVKEKRERERKRERLKNMQWDFEIFDSDKLC